MKVEGEEAKKWKAVRLDSFAEYWPLLDADEDTGKVAYLDRAGEKCEITLGPHVIRLIPR